MLLILVVMLALIGIAGLFAFAYLMDKWHGVLGVAVLGLWVYGMQPASAQDVPNDTNWPSISEQTQPVLYGHNAFGDRIVLFANFCAGDGARRDHMHTYGVYDSHNQFIQGGCWKFDPVGTRKAQTIEYFSMDAGGWDSWPLHSLKPVKGLNVKCRGNSGDDPKTWQACNERDAAQFN